ncbi:Polyketide synthase [Paenibacillus nuruki]|uniref:Polyketide synthase n=1 Tax=Paenibacillus nuruki TaxID=1886670 RepID=A0A1E3L5G9_9BACL|nr:SDR family NAD(P)-dependent oxidoreductase [Paenibacillus nuruki]ODP28425.1 Polyketide synthase [Paenibacillus nuruki]
MKNFKMMESANQQMEAVNELLIQLLWCQLHATGCLNKDFVWQKGTLSFYPQWLVESIAMLQAQVQLLPTHKDNLKDTNIYKQVVDRYWDKWEKQLSGWLQNPDLQAQVQLVDRMLRNLPSILQGDRLATEIMFPESSMQLVEGIYKHHSTADYFNTVLAESASAYVEKCAQAGRKVRILEIGAGTGGTSEVVFEHLKIWESHIEEYVYSDISKAFLMHAEQKYGPSVPYLNYQIIDLKKSFASQGVDLGAYDLIIASNVLHTTQNIRHTVQTVKTTLKKNGMLLVNEITDKSLINHLTFGLLEGWWAYEDKALRISGSPALSADSWKKILKREGFHTITYPASEAVMFKQQIIASQSDGIVIHARNNIIPEVDIPIIPPNHTFMRKQAKEDASVNAVTDQAVLDFVSDIVRGSIAEDLKINTDRIQNDRSFAEYGVDSIIAVHLVNLINKRGQLSLQTTVLFDYNNVDLLVEYLLEEYSAHFKQMLQVAKDSSEASEPVSTIQDNLTPSKVSVSVQPSKEDTKYNSSPINRIISEEHTITPNASDTSFYQVVLHRPSDIQELSIQAHEVPALKEDEVRIAVRAFSLNFGDLLSVKGMYPTMPPYPFTPGFEAAGIVVDVGAQVTHIRSGEDVVFFASEHMGAHATAITCKASQVFAKPSTLSFAEACSLPVVAMTVIAAFGKVQIRPKQRILIQTATGGVGLVAIQLAKHYGAEIYATAGSQHKLDYLLSIGVDHVINYREVDFEKQIKQLTNGQGVDIILNTLSGDALQKGLNSLASNGSYIEIAMTALKSAKAIDLSQMGSNQSFYSLDLRKLSLEQPERLVEYYNEMLDWVAKGIIVPHIGQLFRFDQLQEAYRNIENRENIGKIVVTIPEEWQYHVVPQSKPKPALSSNQDIHSREPIAIIGISGRFAGSNTPDELWKHLEQGTDLIQRVSRWDLSQYYDADQEYCDQGSFLDDISTFDPLFFNISGQEAIYMDPQQRIFLEESWKALEDAGYAGHSIKGQKCGVYVGCTSSDYPTLVGDNPPPQSFWGKAGSIIPARIAYYLDLQGPAIAVDTACSSSLVAIHLACQALWANEINMALAGGVFLQSTPQFYLDSNRAGMLSLEGRCHTFDEKADGFVPGEGAGTIVLKRLHEALEDGDHIYGVIQGSGINQDGTTNGITAPSAKSQTRLEQQVYDSFNINPAHIQMVEAHGTGTKLGDPIEYQALTKAFSTYTNEQEYCAIGSIKTNIGHLATAAGIAGILKIVLSLKNKKIPASLHLEKGNANISFSDSPFYVNTTTKEWEVPIDQARRAAISSFGFSGTNAHMVIEEAPQTGAQSQVSKAGYLIVLSARTEQQLRQQAQQLLSWNMNHTADCAAISYTLLSGRQHLNHRLACIVQSQQELTTYLQQWLDQGESPEVTVGQVNRSENREQLSFKKYAADCIQKCQQAKQDASYLEYLVAVKDVFVQGYEWNLGDIFAKEEQHRIPLPTYPFAKNQYWVPALSTPAARFTSSKSVAVESIHPLLHKNTSDLQQQKYTSIFTGNEFFFRDHIVQGNKVLPGVAHLEWIRAAVTEAIGGIPDHQIIQLKNIVWTSPLHLEIDPFIAHIDIYVESNGDLSFEIYSDSTENRDRLVYSQGSASIIEQAPPTAIDIVHLQHQYSISPISANQFYEQSQKNGITLGESLKGIEVVYTKATEDHEVLARLKMPVDQLPDKELYQLHPSMMDSALQVAIGYTIGTVSNPLYQGKSTLPFTLQKLEIFQPCLPEMWVWARYSAGSTANDKIHKLDIDLCDNEGHICVRFSGFTPRTLEHAITASSDHHDSMLLTPTWTEQTVLSHSDHTNRNIHHIIVLAPSFASIYNDIRTSMPHVHCIILQEEEIAYVTTEEQNAHLFTSCTVQLIDVLKQSISNSSENILLQLIVPNKGKYHTLLGLAATLQTAQQEYSKFKTQCIQVGLQETAINVLHKIKDNQNESVSIVRYDNQIRYIRDWNKWEPTLSEESQLPWKDQGHYLITGGLGGLGYIFAQEIIQQTNQVTLIIVGRSPLDHFMQAKLDQLQHHQAQIHYLVADITIAEDVTTMIDQIRSICGELHGIIHSAGIHRDHYIQHKVNEEIEEVLAPKVHGTLLLDQVSADMPLDFFVLFSSLASVVGNTGQADYATANAFMDIFASERNHKVTYQQRSGKTLSLNFPLWEDGGMQLNTVERTRIRKQLGMIPMDADTGIQLFYKAIKSSQDQVVVLHGDTDKLQSLLQPFVAESLTEQHASTILHHDSTPSILDPFIEGKSEMNSTPLIEKMQSALIQIVSHMLKVSSKDIYPDVELNEYGFDSISFTDFSNQLNEKYHLDLTPTVFFEYSTLHTLAKHLVTTYAVQLTSTLMPNVQRKVPFTSDSTKTVDNGLKQEAESVNSRSIPTTRSRFQKPVETETSYQPVSSTDQSPDPVAIIGMSGRFPMAEDIHALWENLIEGKDCISEIPADRWDWKAYYGDPYQEKNKTNIKWGSFIDGVADFDPMFFGISPREAELMDPQQRLMMMYIWKAIEDAGYAPSSLSGSKMGIFVGTANSGYSHLLSQANTEIEGYSSTGSVSSVGPNRMSFFLNVNGPSEPIETACSSSLVALHRAVQAIHNGDCDTAVVGGVNTILDPDYHISFNKAGMLSQDGRCKTFSDQVNGYVRGEGVGMIFIKRLKDAEQAGDHIYGLIRGTSENHGGRATSLTAPNPRAQADLIKSVYSRAHVDPATISYIEAHGTGTPLGDPIEINGLKMAFNELGYDAASNTATCGLGSIKTNIGHLELAAGIAGIIKVLLQMKHQTLVKTVHFEQLNPYIQLEQSPFYIVDTNRSWVPLQDEQGNVLPRRAGVSSFGFGGVNTHVLVEEYVPSSLNTDSSAHEESVLIVLSARNEQRLREQAKQLRIAMQSDRYTDHELERIAYTLQVGREAMEERLAIRVSSIHELITQLNNYIEQTDSTLWNDHMYVGQVKRDQEVLEFLTADEDMQETVQRWMQKGKYHKLLKLWVKGMDIDWATMYIDRSLQRISLPTYAFENKRYWIPNELTIDSNQNTTANESNMIHPLLHHNTSTLIQQRFTSTFTGKEFFLDDHVIKGQRILPGVAYLEMARASVVQALELYEHQESMIVFKNVTWVRPIAVDKEPVQIHIQLIPQNDQVLHYEIYSQQDDALTTLYNQGTVTVVPTTKEHKEIDISSLIQKCDQQMIIGEECYASFKQVGLYYGPAQQALQNIYVGHQQAIAQLSLPPTVSHTEEQYILHPSMMDAAIQACIGLPSLGYDSVTPFALDEMRIYQSCTSTMWAWVRYQDTPEQQKSLDKVDIDICNEQGELCIELKGLSILHLSHHQDDVQHTVSAPPVGALMQYPVWDSVIPEFTASHILPSTHVLCIGETPALWLNLIQDYPQIRYAQLEIDADVDQITALLEKEPVIDHIVWSISNTIHLDLLHVPVHQPSKGIIQIFRILKSLLQLGYGEKDLAWTIVTAYTQPLSVNENVYAEHAGIAGLVGSLAKEYSNWNIQHVDMEDHFDIATCDLLTLPADLEGNTWLYREKQWYRQQLMIVDAPKESVTSFQQNGVYVVIGGAGGIGEVWSQYMINTYNARIVWIGRRPLNPQIQNKIDLLGQQGIAPLYISADASNLQSLTEAYQTIKQSYSSINGMIHSAVGVMDASLSHMQEEHFQASLSAKIDISLAMMQVFAKEPLEIVLFFSSMSSFSKPIGQSSYAAGCTFTDTFAYEMRKQFEFPIKVISWGYWGEIGIAEKVPTAFKQRLIQSGVGFIEPKEAMQAIEYLVGNAIDHMTFIRTTQPDAVITTHADEQLWIAPEVNAIAIETLQRDYKDHAKVNSLMQTMQIFDQELETLLAHLLYYQLQQAQCLEHHNEVIEVYERWLDHSRLMLKQKNIDDLYGSTEQLWIQWEHRKEVWIQHPDLRAQVVLVDTMLKHLPDIIKGKVLATDIMFPDASMSLLENLYKNNAVADYFNEKLADTVVSYIQARLQHDPSASIRILEAGAGTGGTSSIVLKKLKPYTDAIAEYAYTDLSKAFLNRAEMMFGQDHSYLKYQLFNVEQPVQEQSLSIGSYDIVIAANVLHATQNINRTAKHIHSLLKRNGLLLLNELNRSTLFSHLTFGLLEGWWMYEDASIRILGSPVLDEHHWRTALEYTGFHTVTFPTKSAQPLGQQIIVAASQGLIRLPRSQSNNLLLNNMDKKTMEQARTINTTSMEQDISHPHEHQENVQINLNLATEEPITEEQMLQHSKPYFQQLIGDLVKLPYDQIDISEPLEKYGIDSILIVQLTNKLRKHFDSINSTLFFEHQSLLALMKYFIKEHQQQLIELLEINPSQSTRVASTSLLTNNSSKVISDKGYRKLRMPVQEMQAQEPTVPPVAQSVSSAHSTSPIQQEPIAIIGMSGRYPQADNLEQYWYNLEHGIDCISEIPEERWSIEGFYNPDRKHAVAQGQSYSKWGGFINGFADFDPLFFKLSPREAINMDPQERIFLQSVWESLEDAGHTREKLTEHYKSRVGVFAGITKTGYNLYGPELWKQGSDLFPMTSFSSVANRVSYLLDLHGPSKPVDTMCSSSLTAIHEACESIRSGACELAIAGGVNLYLHPSNYIGLCAQQMLAADSQCKSFAEQADGFVPGEGVGVLLLKPLSKAIADGDAIHAIIRGTGINHGGKTNGYMVPNPTAQANLIRDTMDRAGIHAQEISYIEAHGTGTALGDPIEVSGLTKAFRIDTQEQQYCAIGSVKSNMGHLESAAGIAGITKIILQMKHKKIAPTLHATRLNPEIPFEQTPFAVQQHLSDWKRPQINIEGQLKEVPRIAGISSFGAGGSNAHVILEEYIAQPTELQSQSEPIDLQPTMIVLSARQSEQLIERARQLLSFLEHAVSSHSSLTDIAYTLQVGREAMEERVAWMVHSVSDLQSKLTSFIQQPDEHMPNYYKGTVKRLFDMTSMFDSEEHMQQIINDYYLQGQYDALLELWIQGVPIHWSALNRSVTSNIVHLPAYPFVKEKYWLAPMQTETDIAISDQDRERNASTVIDKMVLHPLLHRNTSQLSEQRFTSIFNGQEFFFADHVVNGNNILPGVAYLEMVREAIAQSTSTSLDRTLWSLENIIWATPIRMEDRELAVHVALYAEDENHIQYEVYTEQESHHVTTRTIHNQGRAVQQSLTDAPILDLATIQKSVKEEIIATTCYEKFEQMGLYYGERLQSISSLQIGTMGVLAPLNIPKMLEASLSSYVLHPSMMDGALQASIGLIVGSHHSADRSNAPLLPFALEQIRIFSACSASMWSYIRYSEGSDPMDKVQKLDIDICHENGEVCASLKGFTSKRLESLQAPLYPKETIMLVPEWLEQDTVTVPEISFHQHIIMVCSPATHIAEQIRRELPDALCIQLGCDGNQPLEQRFGTAALEAFTQVQRLLQSKPEGSILVQLVVVHDQDYQLYTALSGMLKTAELEKPKLIVQMIELDGLAAAFDPVDKLCECRDSAGDTHISYHNYRRYIATWQEFVPSATSIKQAWKDQHVYLITGGMGGIGYLIAQDIAQSVTEPILIITGRSMLDKEIQTKIDKLQEYGAQAFYYVSDITNREEVSTLMNTIQKEFGRLNGIIHSAGVLKDSFMIRKTPEEWNNVLEAKVNGTIYLDQYSQLFELDFFVLFSSLAGVLGNIGQSDYATANAFMDQYAHYRNKLVHTAKRTGHTLSINWPLWEQGGMQMDTQRSTSMKEISGMLPIDQSTAIDALHQALQHEQSQIVVMYGNGVQIRSFMDVDKGRDLDVQDQYFLEMFDHIQSGQYSLDQLLEQHNQSKPF